MKRASPISARMRCRRALRARAARPRPAWQPAGLIWRKPRRAFARISAPAGQVAGRQSWSPRFHLHFHAAVAARQPLPRGRRGAMPAAATSILWRRIDARLTSLLPVVRTVSIRERRQPARHGALRWAIHHRMRRETDLREVVRTLRSIGVPTPPSQGARRGISAVAAPFGARLPVMTVERPPRRRPVPAPVRLEHRLKRPSDRGAPPSAPAARTASRAAAPLRAPELVWRVAAEERPLEAADRFMRAAAASAPPSPMAAPASWPAPAAVEALRPRLLDPALIDRVAEDVIGRVERRIRIERERRGV